MSLTITIQSIPGTSRDTVDWFVALMMIRDGEDGIDVVEVLVVVLGTMLVEVMLVLHYDGNTMR